MLKLTCPACGGELLFKSRISVFAVCSYCSSMIVRQDVNLETLGKMAELPADLTPLQIGTRGKFENTAFEIVGRLKVAWSDGNWNEWYTLFEDGREGWLAEAQGFYMMSFAADGVKNFPTRDSIQPGQKILVPTGPQKTLALQVDDIKEATCTGSEGELPFRCPKGRQTTSVDLSGPDGHFGCIDYSSDGTKIYLGKYVEFDDLRLINLKEINGW